MEVNFIHKHTVPNPSTHYCGVHFDTTSEVLFDIRTEGVTNVQLVKPTEANNVWDFGLLIKINLNSNLILTII